MKKFTVSTIVAALIALTTCTVLEAENLHVLEGTLAYCSGSIAYLSAAAPDGSYQQFDVKLSSEAALQCASMGNFRYVRMIFWISGVWEGSGYHITVHGDHFQDLGSAPSP